MSPIDLGGSVWMVQQRRIALYFVGRKHAYENLQALPEAWLQTME
jgi:hypothetical protein